MEKTAALRTGSKFGSRQIAIIGMLSAVSIILGLSGYGFIPLPTAKATIMHIPVIIGAILEGPAVGVMIGLIFGLFSIVQSLTAPNILSFAFINPLVSVLPRMLIGITAYYTYKYAWGKHEGFRIGLGAAIGSLTNTFGVLTMIYLLYAAEFAAARGIGFDAAAKVIYGIALVNGLPEAIIAVLISVPVVLAIRKRKRV
ncbi:MAG TPA: ECF transporter S component [Methylomusa anaerophila]|uniref:Pantothenic acid transporter PanT n=1 Tax=Methylomusa anaerophila TaxID=1930071 RepID=A0A348AM26_9FIRM|nr:ECF transporter S component [Methylomusa anaerophila]BBB92124.1 pantothenic acid transporter PanT [Methylomusa anaerophila]HML87862.1 ECF transporter S component [Methylomusa anaerophila]